MTKPERVEAATGLRLDKWLWHARFFKTRSRAAAVVTAGHVRINGQRAQKASHVVRVGDALTFTQEKSIRVVRILALSDRRGPAPEAQALYDDLSPPAAKPPAEAGAPRAASGRIDRKERREGRLSKQGPLD